MLTRSKNPSMFYILPYTGRVLSTTPTQRYNNTKWVSVSSLYNYFKKSDDKSISFYKILENQGRRFETLVVTHLRQFIRAVPIPTISFIVNDKGIDRAKRYMKMGYPVLYSVPLVNTKNKTRGIVDLLVRSDYLSKIFSYTEFTDEQLHTGCDLSTKWHYVVVDIKYHTIQLLKDGVHVNNNAKYKYFKTQLYIYNQALGLLQGYTPSDGFIIGRQYVMMKNREKIVTKCYYEKVGVINFAQNDWIERCVDNAIRFKRRINQVKEDKYDITNVWFCTDKHKNILLENNIKSFLDPKCTSDLLGFTGRRARIVDNILETQRQSTHLIRPPHIDYDYIPKKEKKEYYVDFEVMPEVITDRINNSVCNRNTFIFIIGVGYVDTYGTWRYKCFKMNKLTQSEERLVMKKFISFVGDDSVLYHWSFAERSFWNNAMKKYNLDDSDSEWYDLLDLFRELPITIKGCLNFSLKSVARAMYKNNMINVDWGEDIQSGIECAAQSLICYNENKPIHDNAIHYNEIDCKVMFAILDFLRNKYNTNPFLL